MAPWTDAQDKALLIAVTQVTSPNITKAEWDTIAKKLGGVTGSACSQHYRKLKDAIIEEGEDADTTAATPKTKTKASNKRARKTAATSDDGESVNGREDADAAAPAKKRGRPTKAVKAAQATAEAAAVKHEDGATNGGEVDLD